ncbi:MAG: ribosome maturation factor RimP [Desulfobacteraceae bacterium]|nr:ribosome maturation factor RimP [Desulfobacteraceae bacterium]
MTELQREERDTVREVWDLLQPVVDAEGMEILEVEYRRESIGWVLRVFIDSPRGVSVDDCAHISRTAGDVLDMADIIRTRYHLEISSPGLDRPLRKPEHFRNHIGDIIEVRTTVPLQGRRNFKGPLDGASAGEIDVECDGRSYSIPLDLIERARLLYFKTMEHKSQ